MTQATNPWWRGATIYQIYPRSFYDSSGDGIGDLRGILEKLPYIADLGADAIWISPFFKSPMRDFGYDVSDFCAVDPIFGTLDDFDAVVARAHELGVKVLIDQVYSHASSDHAWFQESRQSKDNDKADWFVWADPQPDGTPPNNWLSVFSGPAWTWDARRQQYYLHNFLPSQPDVNVRNPIVQEAILDVARFWLDRGIDGFRLDALNFMMHDPRMLDNPPAEGHDYSRPFAFQLSKYNRSHPDIMQFLTRLRGLTKEYDDIFLMAEIGDQTGDYEILEYVGDPDKLHSAYSFVLLDSTELTPKLIADADEVWHSRDEPLWPTWSFSNHDVPRAVTRWGDPDDPAFAKLLNSILVCMRGTVILYQGEELGLSQADVPFEKLQDPDAIANWPLTKGRDGARTPLPWLGSCGYGGFSSEDPWLPVDKSHILRSVDEQEADPGSVLNVSKDIMRLRHRLKALRDGAIARFGELGEHVLAFTRRSDEQTILCVFNLTKEAQQLDNPDAASFDAIDSKAVTGARDGSVISLPPYGVWIGEERR